MSGDYTVERRLDGRLLETVVLPGREEAERALSTLPGLPCFTMGPHLVGKPLVVRVRCLYGTEVTLGFVPTRAMTRLAQVPRLLLEGGRGGAVRTPWARDNRVLLGVGLTLGLALAGIYALVLRARALAPPAATNRVLLFVLFYIVVVLILALLLVIGRSAARLVLESRRGVFGSQFRVRIVLTHVGLALLPIALLILPTTGLLQRSVEIWFQAPVTETVSAGREVVELVRQRAAETGGAGRLAARGLARRGAGARRRGSPSSPPSARTRGSTTSS